MHMKNYPQELLCDTVLLFSHDPSLKADWLKSIGKAVKDLVDGESTCNFIFFYLNYCRHKTLCSGSLSLHIGQKLLEKQLKLQPSPKSLVCRMRDKGREKSRLYPPPLRLQRNTRRHQIFSYKYLSPKGASVIFLSKKYSSGIYRDQMSFLWLTRV